MISDQIRKSIKPGIIIKISFWIDFLEGTVFKFPVKSTDKEGNGANVPFKPVLTLS